MKSFVVHVSDPKGFDEQTVVEVEDLSSLGKAVQMALDEIASQHPGELTFPLFVDIHPTVTYSTHSWMYQPKKEEKKVAHSRN